MTVIYTGRNLTIEVDAVAYSAQTSSTTVNAQNSATVYQTLTGPKSIMDPTSWELQIAGFQDWDEASSFCDAMVAAATAGDPIPFELALSTGATVTGDIIPAFPPFGGAADSALEFDMTFTVDGTPTYTPAP